MSDSARQKRLFLSILIFFSCFFVVGYTSRLLKKIQLEQDVLHWQEQIVQAQQRSALLAEELAYVRSDAYIHEQARETLGLVQPDDTLIVQVAAPHAAQSNSAITVAATGSAPLEPTLRELPNWQQWLSLFLPIADPAAQP